MDEAANQRLRELISQILAQRSHAVLLTNVAFDPSQLDVTWVPPTVAVVPWMSPAGPTPPAAPAEPS